MRPEFNPWIRKIPWKREWLPTPVFLPGESHGQRSLMGYSSWCHKGPDTTEQLILSLFLSQNWILAPVVKPSNDSCLLAKLCPTVLRACGLQPKVFSVHGIFQARILERLPFTTPGYLPDPAIKPTTPAAPALQVHSLMLSHCESLSKDFIKDSEIKPLS